MYAEPLLMGSILVGALEKKEETRRKTQDPEKHRSRNREQLTHGRKWVLLIFHD